MTRLKIPAIGVGAALGSFSLLYIIANLLGELQ